jgi:hypothetical protein
MNDPIERFLSTDFNGPPSPALRQAVLAQTARSLRRRRLRRRLAMLAALAACFLAGMGTMAVVWQMANGGMSGEGRVASGEKKQNQPAKPPDASSIKPEASPSLIDLEWRAFDSRENRAALFFEVAQRYLEEQNDYESALRCYRQALDAAPKEGLAIRPEDNWLVMALKEARLKENNDAVLNP